MISAIEIMSFNDSDPSLASSYLIQIFTSLRSISRIRVPHIRTITRSVRNEVSKIVISSQETEDSIYTKAPQSNNSSYNLENRMACWRQSKYDTDDAKLNTKRYEYVKRTNSCRGLFDNEYGHYKSSELSLTHLKVFYTGRWPVLTKSIRRDRGSQEEAP